MTQPVNLDLSILNDNEDDILSHTYRSPPFREVHLSNLDPSLLIS